MRTGNRGGNSNSKFIHPRAKVRSPKCNYLYPEHESRPNLYSGGGKRLGGGGGGRGLSLHGKLITDTSATNIAKQNASLGFQLRIIARY